MNQKNTQQTVQKERKFGDLTVCVTSVYQGTQTLERVLREWAVKKVLNSQGNC